MVSRCVFFGNTLGDSLMQIFQDISRADVFIVVFQFDEWHKIRLESSRSGRLVEDIVKDVLAWGIEHYPYTKKECSVSDR